MHLLGLLRWGPKDRIDVKRYRPPIRPELELYINLGIMRLQTALWRDALHMDCRDYVMVFFEFWGYELFRFRIYETGMSIMARREYAKRES
jgi:hypothetical protein